MLFFLFFIFNLNIISCEFINYKNNTNQNIENIIENNEIIEINKSPFIFQSSKIFIF